MDMILVPRNRTSVNVSDGWVAQLVEHRTENPGVAGSIPAPATSHMKCSCRFMLRRERVAEWTGSETI